MTSMIHRMVKPIKNRISQMVGRCLVTMINDSGGFQRLQIKFSEGDLQDNVMRPQDYGFTSHPPDGSEGVVIFQGGLKENPIVIAVGHKESRLKGLSPGDVAIYNNTGSKIVLKSGGGIQIVCNGQDLISVLSDFINAVPGMIVTAPPGTAGGPCTIVQPKFEVIKTQLGSFK